MRRSDALRDERIRANYQNVHANHEPAKTGHAKETRFHSADIVTEGNRSVMYNWSDAPGQKEPIDLDELSELGAVDYC